MFKFIITNKLYIFLLCCILFLEKKTLLIKRKWLTNYNYSENLVKVCVYVQQYAI